MNARSYIFIPPYVFMAWCLIKHKDDFASIFIHIEWEKHGIKAKNVDIGGRKTKARIAMEQTDTKQEREK